MTRKYDFMTYGLARRVTHLHAYIIIIAWLHARAFVLHVVNFSTGALWLLKSYRAGFVGQV